MSGRRGVLLLSLPLLAVLAFCVALTQREVAERSALKPPAPKFPPRATVLEPSAGIARSSPLPPPKDVATAVSNSRIRTAFKNYRAAVVDGNEGQRRALLPVLRRDLDTVLLLARDEVSRAATEPERVAALSIIETLER